MRPSAHSASPAGGTFRCGRLRGMTAISHLDELRAKYRREWDLHQYIADQNARLLKGGNQPSNEQLMNEQRAAEAVALARAELVAAMSAESK